jgi:circadian clock protein KaiC
VFVTFEQGPAEAAALAAGFEWDVAAWEHRGDCAFVDASFPTDHEVVVGEVLDLKPLIARITAAVAKTAAKRVGLDTLTSVHMRLGAAAPVRAELRRAIPALEGLGVTAIITAERDSDYGAVSRYGIEEFVAGQHHHPALRSRPGASPAINAIHSTRGITAGSA